MEQASYLRVTIHDNDFYTSLIYVGKLLYEIFQSEGNYPTEDDFPILKESIKHIWCATHQVQDLIRGRRHDNPTIDYFEPDLEFVDYLDIPNWDNCESVYIPMFDDAEIILV